MQGNLQSITVAEVLLNLHLTRRSGILRLSQNDVKKSIYFLDGSIVFAHSNQRSDRLGETLLRLGKISLEDFEIASREVIDKGKRLGQALSDLGMISAPEINSSVHYQLQQIIYSVFDWDSGNYEFVERERPVFEDIMVDVSTPNLLMDGIRNTTNPAVLERSYQKNEEQVLCLNHDVPRLRRTDLDFGEETILACVDGNKSVSGVRQLAHLAPIEFDRALSSLLLCGMIQLQKQAPASAEQNHSENSRHSFTTQPLPKQDSGRFKTLSEDELSRLIISTHQRFQDATDEEVLSVLPDSTMPEIEKAYQDLSAQFHPPYYSQTRFLDLKDPLKEIAERLSTARDNLRIKLQSRMPLEETPLTQRKSPEEGAIQKQAKAQPPVNVTPVRNSSLSATGSIKGPEMKEPISDLRDRLQKEPENTSLMRRLGKRFYETGKPHEGEKQLLKALELEPQSVENHFALADFYQSLGLKIKAFKHLNIILQLDPNNVRAMELLNVKKSRKPLFEIESARND